MSRWPSNRAWAIRYYLQVQEQHVGSNEFYLDTVFLKSFLNVVPNSISGSSNNSNNGSAGEGPNKKRAGRTSCAGYGHVQHSMQDEPNQNHNDSMTKG